MRQVLSTLLELVGLVAVSTGAFMVSVPLGLLVAGAALFVVGWALERGE